MIALILCILSTTAIFIAFRSFKRFNMDSLQSIAVNYIVCVICGLIYLRADFNEIKNFGNEYWHYLSLFMGFIFVYTFFRMSRTAQEISVAASSMASKLAMVLPVLFSIFIIQRSVKDYDLLNYLGIVLTIPSLVLASWPKKGEDNSALLKNLMLPLSVFILSGFIDTSLNALNANFEGTGDIQFLPVYIFASAGIVGFSYIFFFRKVKTNWNLKSIIGGIYLGIPNFFSLYFLLLSLNRFNQDGAFIFPIVNLGTILLSSFLALSLFGERLNRIQLIGLGLSILAIYFLAYQEIHQF